MVDSWFTLPPTLLVMPDSSLYLEFDNPTAVARARLWPSWARLYPALRPDRWYRVWDVGQDAHGVFLGAGRPLYVTRSHFQIEPIPGRGRELQGERLRTSLPTRSAAIPC